MVVAAGDEWAEGILAGVSSGPVSAVVSERDCLGERDVEPQRTRHRRRHLRNFECVREACALVVVGEDEHLRLAGEPPECGSVQDSITVTLEAGAERIGFLIDGAVAGTAPSRCEDRQVAIVALLACLAGHEAGRAAACP